MELAPPLEGASAAASGKGTEPAALGVATAVAATVVASLACFFRGGSSNLSAAPGSVMGEASGNERGSES